MKKTIIIPLMAVLIISAGAYYFFTQTSPDQIPDNEIQEELIQEDLVLEQTMEISKEYLALRLRTDDVLVNAENYPDYESWNTEMTAIIDDWNSLAKKSQDLENSALETAGSTTIGFNLIQTANAYSAKEISNIYDKAPKFKGIATLAKHLGVDAKRAQVILDQAQAEITSGVFTEEGDAFETLENTATVVKDGCKVVGFVGGVVVTGGGIAGLAAAGTVAQAGVIVVGVDLALEVTEDGAQIAFGDRNKVSSFVKGVRTVTEPIATIVTITNIPGNLGSAYGKFDSVMVGLEQFRESAQEGKVIGVDLKNFEYQKPFQRIRQAKYPGTVTVAEMEMAEVEEWLQSLNNKQEPMTPAEIKEFLSVSTVNTEQKENIVEEMEVVEEEEEAPVAEVAVEEENDSGDADEETKSPEADQPQEAATGPITTQTMAGTYSGSATLQHVEEDVESPDSLPVTLTLNDGGTGTVNVNGFSGDASYAGSNVSFSVAMKEDGAVVNCSFDGKATKNGSQTAISGTMHFSMMGMTFASYGWSAQK